MDYAKHVLGVAMSLAMMGDAMERLQERPFSVGPEPHKRTGDEVEDELQRIVAIRRAKIQKRRPRT